MKKMVMAAGFLTALAAFSGQASADASACASYGSLQEGVNPSFQQVNCLVTAEALEQEIPPEVVKAVVSQESGTWKQFDSNGQAIVSPDGGIGLMQLTNQSDFDTDKLKTDILYNIESGVKVLDKMYGASVPKIAGADRGVIENWYFPVMAYNGIKPVNSPIVQSTGLPNLLAYQEQVFAKIEKNSYLNDTKLAEFPFQASDFQYDPNSSDNIVFTKMSYTVTEQTHETMYTIQKGDRVQTTASPNLRSTPGGSLSGVLPKGTVLEVTGSWQFDQNEGSSVQYVWVPVKSANGQSGYVASAYLEKTDKPLPVKTFTDVPSSHNFYQDITALSSQGIINGFPDGTFRPGEYVTRGQAAIMMVKALQLPTNGTSEIETVMRHEVMNGYTDGSFYADRPVTREQMAIILSNAFKLSKTTPIAFTDVYPEMQAYESVRRVIAAQIAYGYNNNTFRPKQPVTRQESAALINRALQK